MRLGFLWLMPLVLALSACSVQLQPYQRGASADDFATYADDHLEAEERAFLDEVFSAALDRDQAFLTDVFVDTVATSDLENAFPSFFANLPSEQPERVDIVGISRPRLAGIDQTALMLEYMLVGPQGGHNYLRIAVRRDEAGDWRLYNLRALTYDRAIFANPDQLGAFRTIMLVLALASPALVLIALGVSFAIRGLKRRLLWTIAIIFPLPTIAFNWSTQSLQILAPTLERSGDTVTPQLVSWVMTGAQLSKAGDYHPWILTIGLPLGAAWFLTKWMLGELARRPGHDTADAA